MVIYNAIVVVIYTLFSILFRFSPPKERNSIYGFRTKKSMASDANWNFAHTLMGKFLWKSLAFIFVLHLISFVFFNEFSVITGVTLFITQLLVTIVFVNKKLTNE